MTDTPLIATPQAYPLACQTKDYKQYLVVGWTSSGQPVGVEQTVGLSTPRPSRGLEELTDEVLYYLPDLTASVDRAS